MSKRIESKAVSVKATQEINKIIDKLTNISGFISDNSLSKDDMIKKFGEINNYYNKSRQELSKNLDAMKNGITDRIKNYYTKTESDAKFLRKTLLSNAINSLRDAILGYRMWINGGDTAIKYNMNGNTIATWNGVRIVKEGDWLRFINPDGSELFARNINTGAERYYGQNSLRIEGVREVSTAWTEVPNSYIENIGGRVSLPANWCDLMIIVDNTKFREPRTKENEHPYAPSYVYVCNAEVPIKFLTPYGKCGLEVGRDYVSLTAKSGPTFVDWGVPNQGRIIKVLYR